MKRLMVLLVAVGALAACGTAGGNSAQVPQQRDYVGTWTDEGFEAHITNDQIEIDMVSGDMHGLYWKGTFPQPSDVSSTTSVADKEALDASILGSQDSTKKFEFKGDQIDFQASMLGVTRTVHLKKA